jgi:hypothetical protein
MSFEDPRMGSLRVVGEAPRSVCRSRHKHFACGRSYVLARVSNDAGSIHVICGCGSSCWADESRGLVTKLEQRLPRAAGVPSTTLCERTRNVDCLMRSRSPSSSSPIRACRSVPPRFLIWISVPGSKNFRIVVRRCVLAQPRWRVGKARFGVAAEGSAPDSRDRGAAPQASGPG